MKSKRPDFFSPRIRACGLLTAAGFVVCLTTLAGFGGRFSWFLDLFSHFRVQYLVGLTILGVLFLVVRHRTTAIIFLIFAWVNLIVVLPLYFGGQSSPSPGSRSLRAMLLNVNTRHGNPERVRQVIPEVSPDILVLEEISDHWMAQLTWLKDSHPNCVTQPREDNFGIGLFSRFPLTDSEIVYIGSAEVPSVLATVNTGKAQLRIVATHPPPPGNRDYSHWRDEQLDRLPDYVCSARPSPLILLGDLNVTPWNYHFRRLLKRTGLKDSTQGYGFQPTWPNFNPLLRIPIDHCLHSPDIVIIDRRTGPDVCSDHYPLIVDFAIRSEEKGTDQ